VNSRNKGKRGEREWRDVLREHGYQARRGQQFAGGQDSPDVISELPYHWEVKRTEHLRLYDAVDQASRDAKGKPWVIAHRRNDWPWIVVMEAETFFKLLHEK